MKYPEYIFAIDLVMEEYQITNPILISEKIQEDLDMEISIYDIINYLELQNINIDYIKMYENNYLYQW